MVRVRRYRFWYFHHSVWCVGKSVASLPCVSIYTRATLQAGTCRRRERGAPHGDAIPFARDVSRPRAVGGVNVNSQTKKDWARVTFLLFYFWQQSLHRDTVLSSIATMPKGDGAQRRANARDMKEEMEEEKRWKKKEQKKLWFGSVNPLHLFFLLLFTLPTAFTVADYFFNFSKVPGGGYGSLDPAQAVWREKLKAFYGGGGGGSASRNRRRHSRASTPLSAELFDPPLDSARA